MCMYLYSTSRLIYHNPCFKKTKKKQLNPALTGLRVSAGLRWSLKLKSEQNPSRTSQLESKWKTRQY